MNNSLTCLKESFAVGVDYRVPWLNQFMELGVEVVLDDIAPEQIPVPQGPSDAVLRLVKLEYPVRGINRMNQLLSSIGGEAANHYELVAFVKALRRGGIRLRPFRAGDVGVYVDVKATGAPARFKGIIWIPSFVINVRGDWHFSFIPLGGFCSGKTYYLTRETRPMTIRTIFPADVSPLETLKSLFGGFKERGECDVCGDSIPAGDAYCDRCGSANAGFKPALFYKTWLKDIEDYRAEECNLGHPKLKKHMAGHREEWEEWKQNQWIFCSYCGKKFDFVFE